MVDLGDLARLVCHRRARGEAGGDGFVEFLAFEDFHHGVAGRWVHRFGLGNGLQQDEQCAGSGSVVDALGKGLAVFDAAPHLHAIGMQRVHGAADVFDAQLVDEQVGSEIAADGDHGFAEPAERHRLSNGLVHFGVGIVGGIKLINAGVHDAAKLVLNRERLVQTHLPCLHLGKQLDHDGNLHRAGGVERLVCGDEEFVSAIEGAQGNGNFSAARAYQSLHRASGPQFTRGHRAQA